MIKRVSLFLFLPVFATVGCGSKPQASVADHTPPPTPVALAATAVTPDGSSANALSFEAEDARLSGPTVLTKRPGYSGKGYVGDFSHDGDKITWTTPDGTPAGIYTVRIRYCSPFGPKDTDLVVDGSKTSDTLPATGATWGETSGGTIELKPGANTIEIDKGWGYYEIDKISLAPAAAPAALAKPPATPADSQATPAARALLHSLVGFYGTGTLSGQYDADDTALVQKTTGKTPAIMGGDLIEYSPTRLAHGSNPHNETERLMQAARGGQIVTVSWHWNAPSGLIDQKALVKNGKTVDASWYKGFNAEATTFDVQQALAHPGSDDYKMLLRDMDAIAVQLQKFQTAGVPVLWRPLHEAEGGWFWWGAKGPDTFKKLWQLMYSRFTQVHGLHNLIWVYSATQTQNPTWYPGDAFVDVVGVDAYPPDMTDPLTANWNTMQQAYGSKKLLALTEFGGVPDVEKMRRYGVRWSYFVTWNGFQEKTPLPLRTRVYQSSSVFTQSNLHTSGSKP